MNKLTRWLTEATEQSLLTETKPIQDKDRDRDRNRNRDRGGSRAAKNINEDNICQSCSYRGPRDEIKTNNKYIETNFTK